MGALIPGISLVPTTSSSIQSKNYERTDEEQTDEDVRAGSPYIPTKHSALKQH